MAAEAFPPTQPPDLTGLRRIWADLVAAGWREAILRYISHGLMLLVLTSAMWVGQWNLDSLDRFPVTASLQLTAETVLPRAPAPTPATVVDVQAPAALPVVAQNLEAVDVGQVSRLADVQTLLPTRGRAWVITYTVQEGDTLVGIAEKFGLRPETVLWGNYYLLKDDPHLLTSDQVLNILPVDGAYHYFAQGDTLEHVARFYGVAPQDINGWRGNRLNPQNLASSSNTWIVIPGGRRELQAWAVPAFLRTARTKRANNFGQCPGGYSGAVGSGAFVWPTESHVLSGYTFSEVHRGLDLRAGARAPVYAVDGGVVVYAGPNDYGYGNLVVVDHGNGWQSVYAHLSQWNVTCGQSVSQGELIGLAGSAGHVSGAHLHFELSYNGAYVDPWAVLP